MIPELGSFAIILALCFAVLQGLFFFSTPKSTQKIVLTTAIGQFLFLAFAMLCLIASFLNNDMTVIYVREHSHELLPFLYRVGAAWGGHEGSVLLWCLILSGWTLLFGLYSQYKKTLPDIFQVQVLAILGFLSSGFILFLLATSNPFARNFPTAPVSGDDLTPILQDPGLIFHPPMLYLGYVGFAIAFAFAIAALITGKFDKSMAAACRPWVILPWSFLGCGIVLGSWWAYRELGWGGWWFWDPVENASLLPWLSATALLHSLIVSEKRDAFKGWTILLAIITFSLSLLGTFLVRSGVLVSVHAFASDPTRGIFLLSYLGLIIGGALLLYSLRIKAFFQAPKFNLLSRETFLLINSVILLTAVATIVLGTLYPIILDALNMDKISVGEPYFNIVFVPIILPLLLLMGFAPHVHWQEQSFSALWKKLQINFFISILFGIITPLLFGFDFHLLTAVGLGFAFWIIFATLQYVWQSRKHLGLSHWAMVIAHLGIAVTVVGITVNKSYSEERQVKMKPGETVTVAQHQFIFDHLAETQGPNFRSVAATFLVDGQELTAQQRIYTSHEQTLSKPGVLFNGWRDLYLALGSPLADDSWSVRIYYKPFVRWIWCGGFILLIGGLISVVSYLRRRA